MGRNRNKRYRLNLKRFVSVLVVAVLVVGSVAYGSSMIHRGSTGTWQDSIEISATPVTSVSADSSLSASDVEVSCGAYLLYDQTTGEILLEKNADVEYVPASITKVMTAILTLENLALDQEVTITADAVWTLGNTMYLQEGEIVTVEQLLNCLLVYSANDAALALAIAVAGSVDDFVVMMNEKAAELGANNTNFLNPNGYTNDSQHHTTAKDLKIILDYALSLDGFREITCQGSYSMAATNLSEERSYESTNLLLYDEETLITVNGVERTPKYEGVFGLKTGMMAASGYCICVGAQEGDTTLVAICLQGASEEDRVSSAISLLDYGFSHFTTASILTQGTVMGKVKVQYGATNVVKAVCAEDICLTVDTSTAGTNDEGNLILSYEVTLYDDVQAPLSAGDAVGEIRVVRVSGETETISLVAAKDVKKGGFWSAWYIPNIVAYLYILVLLVVLLFVGYCLKDRKRRRHSIYRKGRW